jgi:hypothetical protein
MITPATAPRSSGSRNNCVSIRSGSEPTSRSRPLAGGIGEALCPE